MKITRHFVTVGERRVHYLRTGSGPAVAMLHACPVSAKVMRPLMQIFARRFTCLAFDMPGFGQSDKLPIAQPSVEDFADALADTLTALGIQKVASYGRHTGASIAVEFAARHPDRCSMALADGYAVFTSRYSDEALERYLEPITPAWDGAHLLRLWFRYRDQHAFWPWNAQDDAHRSDTDTPDTEFLHRGVIEMLEAGKLKGSGTGQGGIWHLGLAGWLVDAKLPGNAIGWVPSQGAAPGLQDLAAGGVDLVSASLPEGRSLIEAGKVRPIVLMAEKPDGLFPQVPLLKSSGSSWTNGAWRGVAGPKGMPKDVVERLSSAIKQIYDSKAYKDFLAARGFGEMWAGPADFAAFMARDDAAKGEVMKAVGLAK